MIRQLRKALIEGSFLSDVDARDMACFLRETLDDIVVLDVLPAG